jgi:CBS domain-containing protein
VREDEDLLVTTEQLGALPGVHTVAVVDSQERLVGIIPMRLVLDDLFLEVAPEEFLADLKDTEGVEEFGRISRARTAGELMEEPAFVTMDDTARDAFARMHERKLEGLPIVDAEMKVVGYLDRLQLLRLWLKQHGKKD